jgi:hypothetical protein
MRPTPRSAVRAAGTPGGPTGPAGTISAVVGAGSPSLSASLEREVPPRPADVVAGVNVRDRARSAWVFVTAPAPTPSF